MSDEGLLQAPRQLTPNQLCDVLNRSGFSYPLPCGSCSFNDTCAGKAGCPAANVPVTYQISGCMIGPPTSCKDVNPVEGEVWTNVHRQFNELTGNSCANVVNVGAAYCYLSKPSPAYALDCCLNRVSPENQPRQCGGQYCRKTCENLDIVREYCSKCENFLSPGCQIYCPVGDPNNRASWCDQAAEDFCSSIFGFDLPVCRCFNSPLLNQGPPAPPPVCFDPVCSTQGYKTRAMLDLPSCPTFCQQVISCVDVGNCTIANNVLTQVCGSPPIPIPPGPNPSPNPSPDGNGTNFFNQTILGIPVWVLLLILSIIIGLIFLVVLFRRFR